MLKRINRLRSRKDFNRLYRTGRQASVGEFSVRAVPNRLSTSRVAVVTSTKVAKKAVTRNRIRRRIFGKLRLVWGQLKPGFDIAVIVHKDISKIQSNTLSQKIDLALRNLRII